MALLIRPTAPAPALALALALALAATGCYDPALRDCTVRCRGAMSTAAVSTDALLAVLRERFGHDAFRPGQQRVVRSLLAQHDVHSVGRYGGWTYCSIEDNLLETRELARLLS